MKVSEVKEILEKSGQLKKLRGVGQMNMTYWFAQKKKEVRTSKRKNDRKEGRFIGEGG